VAAESPVRSRGAGDLDWLCVGSARFCTPRSPPCNRRSAGDSGRMGTRPAWPRRRGRFCPGAVAGSVDRSRGIVATLLRGAALSAGRPPLSLVPKTSTALDAGDDCRFHPVGVCWLGRPQLTRWLTSAVAPTVNAAVSGAAEASDISGSDRDCRFRDERKPEDRRRELRPSPISTVCRRVGRLLLIRKASVRPH
jgi:hypothetical protein